MGTGAAVVIRPAVSVVMPFAGPRAAAMAAQAALAALRVQAGDELILADNSGSAPRSPAITVILATGEQSPSRARNAGARHAHRDWILFAPLPPDRPITAPPMARLRGRPRLAGPPL